jgi:5'-3' exonuclease
VPTRHTVHLIDASPYLFRAYFAVPESIVDPRGKPVNAVYGFANFLLRYVREQAPTHVGVAFDQSLTTSFRNELYPGYKAQRELPPEDLEAQQRDCREMARALGMVTWADRRFEADDLIASACRKILRGGHRVVVVTPDKDLCQLVEERVELFDFAKEKRYGPAQVVEKLGVRPEQVADLLGLAGDPVDDIPGVPGIGSKTAVALLAAFGDLDALYADLEAVAALSLRGARSVAAKLAEHRELAFLSRELATVSTGAPAPARMRELAWRGARRELVERLTRRLGLEGVARRVPRWRRGR